MSNLRTIAIAAAAFVLAFTFALPAQAAPEDKAGAVKQLTIMSRILETRLNEQFEGEVHTSSMFQRGPGAFYVPGTGAIFLIDVRFPVARPKAPDSKETEPAPDDLWDQFEQEIERGPRPPAQGALGGPYGGAFGSSGGGYGAVFGGGGFGGGNMYGHAIRPEPDPRKIERLKSTLFEAFRNFGDRMTVLGEDEQIIVIVTGGGTNAPIFIQSSSVPVMTQPPAMTPPVSSSGSPALPSVSARPKPSTGAAEPAEGAIVPHVEAGPAVAEVQAHGTGSNVSHGVATATKRLHVIQPSSGHSTNVFSIAGHVPGGGGRSVLILQIPRAALADGARRVEEAPRITEYAY